MSGEPRVLVAHADPTIRHSAVAAAQEAGYQVVGVADGLAAEADLLSGSPPQAMVVDAGLPGRAGFELCELIEAQKLPTRVVLIASVYSKTAYKRKPTSLYGADDYVEQHHIVDMLGPKLAALVPAPKELPAGRSAHKPATLTPEQRAEVEAVRQAGEDRLKPISPNSDDRLGHAEAVARAQQLARLIVTDMLLYSGSEAQHWARSQTRSMPPRLAQDLEEARRLLSLSVPVDVVGTRDLVGEAFVELLHLGALEQEGQ